MSAKIINLDAHRRRTIEEYLRREIEDFVRQPPLSAFARGQLYSILKIYSDILGDGKKELFETRRLLLVNELAETWASPEAS
jgi:hypothetical protein